MLLFEKFTFMNKANYTRTDAGVNEVKEFFGNSAPDAAIILGTGLGEAFEIYFNKKSKRARFSDFSHLPQLTVDGHKGEIVLAEFGTKKVLVVEGRKHFYEGATYSEVVRLVQILAKWGIRTFFITNAAGAIDKRYVVGDIVFINDHDPTYISHLIDPPTEDPRERFASIEGVYDHELTHRAYEIGVSVLKDSETSCRVSGRYVAVKGPDFETKMQIRSYAQNGATLVGMSTIPEVVALARAKHANKWHNMRIVAVSIVSNMAAGVTNTEINHNDVMKTVSSHATDLAKILYKTIINDK